MSWANYDPVTCGGSETKGTLQWDVNCLESAIAEWNLQSTKFQKDRMSIAKKANKKKIAQFLAENREYHKRGMDKMHKELYDAGNRVVSSIFKQAQANHLACDAKKLPQGVVNDYSEQRSPLLGSMMYGHPKIGVWRNVLLGKGKDCDKVVAKNFFFSMADFQNYDKKEKMLSELVKSAKCILTPSPVASYLATQFPGENEVATMGFDPDNSVANQCYHVPLRTEADVAKSANTGFPYAFVDEKGRLVLRLSGTDEQVFSGTASNGENYMIWHGSFGSFDDALEAMADELKDQADDLDESFDIADVDDLQSKINEYLLFNPQKEGQKDPRNGVIYSDVLAKISTKLQYMNFDDTNGWSAAQ